MSHDGQISVRLSFEEVGLIRGGFFAKIDGLADDQEPDDEDIALAERITRQAERRWGVKYQQVFR